MEKVEKVEEYPEIPTGAENPLVKSLVFWNLPAVEGTDNLKALANDFSKKIEEECPGMVILGKWAKHRRNGEKFVPEIKLEKCEVAMPDCSYMIVHFGTREQADAVYKHLKCGSFRGQPFHVMYTHVPTT